METWLKNEFLTGFQKLATLGLDGQPAAEVLPATVAVWLDAITANKTFDETRDALRIRAAFRTLALSARRWPTPAAFLEALPPPPREKPALRIVDENAQRRGMQHCADLMARLHISAKDGAA